MAGKRYIMNVSLRLDLSFFSCIVAQSSLPQMGGALSRGMGVQHTTQCLCGLTPDSVFLLAGVSLLREAAARAS
jgi:hypothetical protein